MQRRLCQPKNGTILRQPSNALTQRTLLHASGDCFCETRRFSADSADPATAPAKSVDAIHRLATAAT